MEKATIELTKEEAQLLPLLYKAPLTTNLESAVKVSMIVDGLMEKVRKAFAPEEAPTESETVALGSR